jgi:hypothetical protein
MTILPYLRAIETEQLVLLPCALAVIFVSSLLIHSIISLRNPRRAVTLGTNDEDGAEEPGWHGVVASRGGYSGLAMRLLRIMGCGGLLIYTTFMLAASRNTSQLDIAVAAFYVGAARVIKFIANI